MTAETAADGSAERAVNGLPPLPGTYALVMRALQPRRITVGRLGVLNVVPGCYIYLGSAMGPGGLAGRLGRHLRPLRCIHWHIDYLRQALPLAEIWYTIGDHRCECTWARLLAALPGAGTPLHGFGSSDCRCSAHLVHLASTDIESAWTCLASYVKVDGQALPCTDGRITRSEALLQAWSYLIRLTASA